MWLSRDDRLQYIVIIVILLAVAIYCYYQQYEERNGPPPGSDFEKEGNGEIYYRGRGSDTDDIEVLLDRIDWLANTESRITWWTRMMFPTLFITLAVVTLVFRRLPKPFELVLLIILIFMFSLLFHSYFYTHGDYYVDAYLESNTALIRDKLNIQQPIGINEPPPPQTNDIPDRVSL